MKEKRQTKKKAERGRVRQREREGGGGEIPKDEHPEKTTAAKKYTRAANNKHPPQKEKTERRKRDLHKQNKHLSKARERVPPSTKTHTHTQKGPTEMAHCVWRGEVGGAE